MQITAGKFAQISNNKNLINYNTDSTKAEVFKLKVFIWKGYSTITISTSAKIHQASAFKKQQGKKRLMWGIRAAKVYAIKCAIKPLTQTYCEALVNPLDVQSFVVDAAAALPHVEASLPTVDCNMSD